MSDGIDFDLYSDLYKEINGTRPRSRPTKADYDSFMASYDERFEEVNSRMNDGMRRAVEGANAELGTKFESIMDMDRAANEERDPQRYDILLKWLTSF